MRKQGNPEAKILNAAIAKEKIDVAIGSFRSFLESTK
jgi:hypothetical protein